MLQGKGDVLLAGALKQGGQAQSLFTNGDLRVLVGRVVGGGITPTVTA